MTVLQNPENSSRFTNVSVIAPESQGQQQGQQQQEQQQQPQPQQQQLLLQKQVQDQSQQPQPQQQEPQKQSTGTLKTLNGFSSVQQPIFTANTPSTPSADLSDNPAWFNNPKKRAIPSSILKRSTGQSLSPVRDTADASVTLSKPNGFNNVTFGSKKDPRIPNNVFQNDGSNNTTNNSHNHDLNAIVFDSNEAPPKASLADWQKEDGILAIDSDNIEDPNLTANMTLDQKLTTPFSPFKQTEKKARLFNLFDKTTKVPPNNEPLNNRLDDITVNNNTEASPDVDNNAVIIFGYPESIANSIILHFANFGEILEDFKIIRDFRKPNLKNKPSSQTHTAQKRPIYTGDGWVKLTYDSQVSKNRALQENGLIMNGTLIGCVSYSRAALKQLASLNNSENITGDITGLESSLSSNGFSNYKQTEGFFENAKTTTATSRARNSEFKVSKNSSSFKNSRKLEIKDGRSLFLRNRGKIHSGVLSSIESDLKKREQEGRHKKGWLNRLNNWLFGWNDL
ncbi:hypothetical protein SEUBUCD646_0M02890 [Saccharomyces eubayanus]|uniref:Nucleoporin nup53 n=2 Tax=Saccharomyces TaxID=4930 RepID=A0A6C1EDX3_SACPS|nr:Nucleoporin nup53 [Saccharomyces pastorianus]CAI1641859.1 hypothetical protein SEUBUCD650_0M02850 [Saccharomyces eubayanus]CAI1670362.1 hypothetical protein SEUBUCD646_0M02890 [Saccharomyces eubayanus]